MIYTELQKDIEGFIHSYMHDHNKPALLYHNREHTHQVVKAAKQLGNHFQLNEQDFFIVTAAAWFHDIGYYSSGREDHEKEGARLAAEYLKQKNVESGIIAEVQNCILATSMPQRANTLLEKIVCDADLFHLGTDDFSERNKLMRKEVEAVKGSSIEKYKWRNHTIQLLQQHHYYTDYGQLLLNDKKQQNLDKLLQKQASQGKENVEETLKSSDSKGKEKEPGRGIETMFRITATNNQRLSDMADNKAQILITVNSIILSVIISVLLRKLDNNTYLLYPTLLILAVSVATMVISILATRPSIPHGVFTQQDVDAKKVNLLFFGNFYKMELEAYATGMRKVMADRDFLYGTLIKDVYSQGVVLGRKYKLLRLAYNIFMFGIIASVIGFVISIYSIQ